MGVLRRIETRIAGAFEGVFNRSSRGGIQPVEIAQGLVEEMEGNKVTRNGVAIAPSLYTLFLSNHDRTLLRSYEHELMEQLEAHLFQHARSEGYRVDGSLEVGIRTDPDLKRGLFGIFTDGAEPSVAPGNHRESQPSSGHTQNISPDEAANLGLARQVLVLEWRGRVREFSPGGVVVGRSTSADFHVDDPNVSRRHAEFFWEGGRVFIRDLNSTNGTVLNGRPVTSAPLDVGDVISLGDNEITVRAGP